VRSRGTAAAVVALAILAAACSGRRSPAAPTPPATPPAPVPGPGLSEPVTAMLLELPSYIARALAENQANLPRNPHNAVQIQAKIAMLQNPSLAAEIIDGHFYVEGGVSSRNGRIIPVVAVFAREAMRAEATDTVRSIELALPVLENFMATAFPRDVIRVWYGFIIGNRGGGGTLYMEDRTTYESRTSEGRLPYEAITDHELAHSYISHEALTQFLELYTYNMVHTGSADPRSWAFARSCVALSSANEGVCALLDVHLLIGPDAMAAAYATVRGLNPPYGQPLDPAVKQVFVDHAPAALKAEIAAKMDRVTY